MSSEAVFFPNQDPNAVLVMSTYKSPEVRLLYWLPCSLLKQISIKDRKGGRNGSRYFWLLQEFGNEQRELWIGCKQVYGVCIICFKNISEVGIKYNMKK